MSEILFFDVMHEMLCGAKYMQLLLDFRKTFPQWIEVQLSALPRCVSPAAIPWGEPVLPTQRRLRIFYLYTWCLCWIKVYCTVNALWCLWCRISSHLFILLWRKSWYRTWLCWFEFSPAIYIHVRFKVWVKELRCLMLVCLGTVYTSFLGNL